MPHLSHSTFGSNSGASDNCHWLSLDPWRRKIGTWFVVYEAKLRSKAKDADPRHNTIVQAKFPTWTHGTEAWANTEVERADLCRKIAEKFNKVTTCMDRARKELSENFHCDERETMTGVRNNFEVTFLLTLKIHLETVSFLDRTRRKGEFCLYEDKLSHLMNFVDKNGKIADQLEVQDMKRGLLARIAKSAKKRDASVPNRDNDIIQRFEKHRQPAAEIHACSTFPSCPPGTLAENDRAGTENNQIFFLTAFRQVTEGGAESNSRDCEERSAAQQHLDAFIHFFFCNRNGCEIVCNLQGTYDDKTGFVFTNPTIHSMDKRFGSTDEGVPGMLRVINNHKCTRYCRHFMNMQYLFREAVTCKRRCIS